VKVKENVVDNKTRQKSTADVGIGEYQIFRARQAFGSLKNGGKTIEVEVIDENGDAVDGGSKPSRTETTTKA
jgi:hypothetical protein